MDLSPVMVVVAYVAILFARRKLHDRKVQAWLHKRRRFPLAVLAQPYTCLMAVFMIFYTYLMVSFNILLSRYKWLDPETFTLPNCTLAKSEGWSDYTIPGPLRFMALISPWCIFLTWIFTLIHWWQHLRSPRSFDEDICWYPSYSHDLAMQVVALPLVYGIFSLDSVLEMLRLLTGQSFMAISEERREANPALEWDRIMLRVNQKYDTNQELADLYEAWALRCFGMLCFLLVSRQVKREVPTVKYIISTIKDHLRRVTSEGNGDRGILEEIKILNDPGKLLYQPLQQTSRIGVVVFVWTYALKSGYLLGLNFLAQVDLQLCGPNGKFKPACSLLPYLDGACFLASTLAIYNIVVFEHNLSDILNEGQFRPFAKFLGVKLMVSIAFIQSFALNVLAKFFWDLSKEQIDLCYSCLVCCEVVPLSLLLYYAWRPCQDDWHAGDFYGHLRPQGGMETSMQGFQGRGQLADEDASSFDESLQFQQSRELSISMEPRQALHDELTGFIELRGEVEACEAKVIEDLVNTLSKGIKATYRPAALFRTSGASFRQPAPGGSRSLLTTF